MNRIAWMIFFFSILCLNISAQTQRSLMSYPEDLSLDALRKIIEENGGKIMVSWPGNAYVRWATDPPDLNEYFIYQKVNIVQFADWAETQQNEDHAELQCDTSGIDDAGPRFNKGLSDTLKGHTVCAIFFVNQINSANPWTLVEQSQCMENAALNLAWWSEQAHFYDVEVSFELKPYYFDHPACQITVDPTSASTGNWIPRIMSNLGFSNGNITEQQIAFTQNLIQQEQSDWGFIAYIIRGQETFRSVASIFGPSTICWVNATRTGMTFAHEVGHIFGLRDEYEERAAGTFGSELNGLPNLNADFRNLINAPCIMKMSSAVGICCYNAYHLYWTDKVNEFKVNVEPEDALFRVEYFNTVSNQPILTRIHQGQTRLPMGYGSRFRLSGLPEISVNSGKYNQSQWQENGSETLLVDVNKNSNTSAQLTYQFAENKNMYVSFLDMGIHYAGRRIHAISRNEDAIIFASNNGLSVHNNGEYLLLDKEVEVRPGEFLASYRNAHCIEKLENNQWLVGSQLGTLGPEIGLFDNSGEIAAWTPPSTFREQGYYRAVTRSKEGYVLGAFDAGGLHRFGPDSAFQIINNRDGLPDDFISSMAIAEDGLIWIGYDGGRTGKDFTGLYFLNTDNWSFSPASGIPARLSKAAIRKIRFLGDQTIMVVTDSVLHVRESGVWKEIVLPNGTVFDADRINPERWALATSTGIYYMDSELQLQHIQQPDLPLQENIARSIISISPEIIIAGHANYGGTAIFIGDRSLSSESVEVPPKSIQIYPNPLSGNELQIKSGLVAEDININVCDLNGRTLFNQRLSLSPNQNAVMNIPSQIPNGIYIVRTEGKFKGFISLLSIQR